MSREIRFYVSYGCPRCVRQLEAKSVDWDGWLRCPACDWPCLPPELMAGPRGGRQRNVVRQVDNAVEFLPTSPALTEARTPPAGVVARRSAGTSPARLIFMTGLAISLFLVLAAFLERQTGNMTIFGLLALGFLGMLVRSPRNRPAI